MAAAFNPHTQRIITAITRGEQAQLGGKAIPAFSADECRAFTLLAEHLGTLQEERGGELARTFVDHFVAATSSPESEAPQQTTLTRRPQRLRLLRTFSFRGLAPADTIREHEFRERSRLLYGSNACGRSSLVGAICWCLIGWIFRDDCPPSYPEDMTVYTTGKKTAIAGTRADALSLMDAVGASSALNAEYWVALLLAGETEDGTELLQWVRRHSVYGLARSSDGETWEPITRLEEIGIDECGAELHLLMPARILALRH